ncbi:MAG: response regulator [Verrucomicrobia bacterium]|nr:response regulator [Verrucomicrobiota bacterium]MDE3098231.1 response regulator [Verrucomicrobiota bacterium]
MKKLTTFSTVRLKLAGTVFLLIVPALLMAYIYDVPMGCLAVGFMALVAAWMGGEFFVRRQVQALSATASRIADGDLTARTGLPAAADELGQLAGIFDRMAESLGQRICDMERLAAFAQFNPYAAMEFTNEGRLIWFNRAASELSLSVGQKDPSGILPEGAEEIIRDCLATGRSRLYLETKIGRHTLSWSFHPVPQNRMVHGYAEDITLRLTLEEQLRQSQKMDSIEQLVGGVAHDFNNLLTIIQGHSSALLARPALPADMASPVQAVSSAAERAAGLTRQLLMFSRKNVVQRSRLNLGEVIGNMNARLSRLLGESILLQFQSPEALPPVSGDAGMIEQMVMNLSANARDAMPAGGKLLVSLKPVAIGRAYLEAHPAGRAGAFVRLRISDTGTGMDRATQSRIFEPFFTTKEIGKGTGLGLATVYGIVKQHEGWIEVNSEPGQGATFDLFFPILEKAAAAPKRRAGGVGGGAETILIVEDEPLLREMTREILAAYGYKILEAATGKEALEVWKQHHAAVDLLLTDLIMPAGMSGVDLAEKLLADHPNLRVVFTSGCNTRALDAELRLRSQARFLPKPFTCAELAENVRNCLDRNGVNY